MTANKVVIKINYDKKQADSQMPAQTVTEWHTGRMVMALLVSIILTGFLVYSLMNMDGKKVVLTEQAAVLQPVKNEITTDTSFSKPLLSDEKRNLKKPLAVRSDDSIKTMETQLKKRVVINVVNSHVKPIKKTQGGNTYAISQRLDNRVTRAVLARRLKNKEPVGKVLIPLRVNKNKAIGIYYFTEINDMKNQVLFHEWYHNNRLVFKRKINILGHRWRASTSKLMSYSSKGHWIVKLVDKSGNTLSEIDFNVIQNN